MITAEKSRDVMALSLRCLLKRPIGIVSLKSQTHSLVFGWGSIIFIKFLTVSTRIFQKKKHTVFLFLNSPNI